MTFDEVIFTIENKRRFGKAYGRDVTAELMEALGHPESDFEIIHIAGTNGKGSVAAFVSSILQAASFSLPEESRFKVGTFTSPHLIDFTERIMIDGRQIPREDARRIGQMLLECQVKLEPTMFDYCLAMAMIYFKEQGVKYVVLETGLGGSKDSTAGLAVVPSVCAITSIGLEHTQILGDTIELIAAEKAGILKKGTRLVVGQMPDEALRVIREKASELSVECIEAGCLDKSTKLGLFGGYQRANGAVAVEICRLLGINEDDILNGLKAARWPGRMDIVSKNPFVMLDGAHNPSGVKALHDSLVAEFPNEKYTLIMAVMADKDYMEMAQLMEDVAERIFTTTIDYGRALEASDFAEKLQACDIEARCFEDYKDAIAEALKYNEKVIVFGSLYFIGEVLQGYDKNKE